MSNSSIWPINRTLSGAITPGQSGPGALAMKGYFAFPKSHHQISVISRTLMGWVLLSCRDAVSVFYSPSLLGLIAIGAWCIGHSWRNFKFWMKFPIDFVLIPLGKACIDLFSLPQLKVKVNVFTQSLHHWVNIRQG